MAKKLSAIILLLILSLAVCAVALVGCNVITNKSTDSKAEIAEDSNGNPLYGGESYIMPDGMAFSAASGGVGNSVTLTAVYAPEGTSNQSTIWDVSFVNPESAWATGKNASDYVSVSPISDNSATVECLAAFGEQIIITATSAVDSAVSDTTTVDFKKKVEDVRFTLYYDGAEVASICQSEFDNNQSEVFAVTRKEASGSAVPINPWWEINVNVDYTGEAKSYTLGVQALFSDYTIDESYTFNEYVSVDKFGEHYSPIAGSENGIKPSSYFVADAYFTSSLTSSQRHAIECIDAFVKNPGLATWTTARDNLAALNDYPDSEFRIGCALLIGQCEGMTDAQMKDVVNGLPDKAFCEKKLNSYSYMGQLIDMTGYSSLSEYFSANNAASFKKVCLAENYYQLNIRINPDTINVK